MTRKTQQLQIRVAPEQKAALKRAAASAGMDLSGYVLSRALPPVRSRVNALLAALEDADGRRFALAELNDLLTDLSGPELVAGLGDLDVSGLTPLDANYVAAMVELAAHRRDVPPPRWVRDVPALERPHFATPLPGLRAHLLRSSPVPFRRRNIFIDASLGDRV